MKGGFITWGRGRKRERKGKWIKNLIFLMGYFIEEISGHIVKIIVDNTLD
jgi:hypothetical protein